MIKNIYNGVNVTFDSLFYIETINNVPDEINKIVIVNDGLLLIGMLDDEPKSMYQLRLYLYMIETKDKYMIVNRGDIYSSVC